MVYAYIYNKGEEKYTVDDKIKDKLNYCFCHLEIYNFFLLSYFNFFSHLGLFFFILFLQLKLCFLINLVLLVLLIFTHLLNSNYLL